MNKAMRRGVVMTQLLAVGLMAAVQAEEARTEEAPSSAPPAPVLLAQVGPGDTVTIPRAEWEGFKARQERLEKEVAELRGQTSVTPGGTETAEPGKATGWYLGMSAGRVNRKQSTDITAVPQTAAVFSNGFGLNGMAGYRFGNGIRLEAESSYQNNKNKTFITNTATGTNEPSVGNVGLRAFMANVYYDLPLKKSRFKPYIGAGYGVYQSSINGFTAPSLSGANIVLDTRSTETNAWQYRIGTSYAVNRRTEFTLGYRKFLGTKLKFRFDVPPVPGLVVPLDVTGGNTGTVEAGVRVFF